MELKALVVGAQEAMERADFRLALAANTHALTAYPACLAAHRMLGEAYLERGDQESAVKHFERTVQIDPLNVVARLGLGVAAEETKNFPAAYAHYLHAWEINPALDQVRDELVRLRGLLNVDDRLHPTRAGLAGIHARAGQFRRAIGDWRAVLAVEPESRRGRTALAELLWRGGDDAGAAFAAREALRGSPDNARALAIMADVERRRGSAGAEEIAQRYAQIDPTGDVIAVLQPWRIDADLSFLRVDSAPLDDFDFVAHRSRDTGPLGGKKSVTASLAASQLAAPDLWDTLVKDLSADIPSTSVARTMASGVEPFNWNENQLASSAEPAPQSSQILDLADQLFSPSTPSHDPSEDAALAGIVPFALPNEDAGQGEAGAANASAAAHDGQPGIDSDSFDDLIRAMEADDPAELDLAAMAGQIGSTAANHTSDDQGAAAGVNSSEAVGEASSTARPTNQGARDFVDPFVTADGQIDLTQGWDELDRALADATPTFQGDEGFDDLLADLDGIQPFDAVIEGADEDAWAPLFADEAVSEPAASVVSASVSETVDGAATPDLDVSSWFESPTAEAQSLALPAEDEIRAPVPIDTYASVIEAVEAAQEPRDATGELLDFADLEAFDVTPFLDAADVPPIESEIITGIPAPQPSGYTELLRNVDDETFTMSDESAAAVNPFAIPDGTGDPLDFNELIEVTSSDGTGPLAAVQDDEVHVDAASEVDNPLDFTGTDLDAALPQAEHAALAMEFDGIEPFDSTAFGDGAAGEESVGFGEIDRQVAEVVPDLVADLELAPFTLDLRPFGYTDALAALDGEPFDFSDVVVEPEIDAVEITVTAEETGLTEATESDAEPEAASSDADSLVAEADSATAPDEAEAATDPVPAQLAAEQPGWAGKEGMGTVAHKVLWPKFVNQTSVLIDRALETDDLFARIAAQKETMVAQGEISIGRRVSAHAAAPEASREVERQLATRPAQAVMEAPIKPAIPQMSEQTRLDLMAMRIRLIEDEDAAPEIVEALERAMAEGLLAPLALRVLGEAYLKMGLVERAAAQFRQAMLARRRVSQESRLR